MSDKPSTANLLRRTHRSVSRVGLDRREDQRDFLSGFTLNHSVLKQGETGRLLLSLSPAPLGVTQVFLYDFQT